MAEQVGAINVIISANPEALKKGLQSASKSLEEFGKRAEKLGKDISMKVTAPITALGAASVAAFAVQEKAEMRLRAALAANGRQVESLFKDYATFASELQKITVVGDEATLAMLQQAESLGLTGEAAKNAVKNAIAMQAAFNVNAESALRYTSALAQGDATMLTRYIPALKQTTDAAERVAIAQDVLSKAFAAAEGEANSFSGQLQQTKNTIGDLMEQFGAIVSESIAPLIKRVKEMAEQFQQLDQSTKQTIVVIGGLVAAIGPALIIIGKISVGLAALPALFAAISGPVGLVVLGVTALVAGMVKLNQYIDDNSSVTQKTREQVAQLKDAYDRLKKAQDELNSIQDGSIQASEETIKQKKEETKAIIKNAEALLQEIKARKIAIQESIKAEIRAMQTSKLGGGAQAGRIQQLSETLKQLEAETKQTESSIFQLTESLYDLENPIEGAEQGVQVMEDIATGATEATKAVSALADENMRLAELFGERQLQGGITGLEQQLGLTGGGQGAGRIPIENFTEDFTDLEPPEMPTDIPGSEEMFNNFINKTELMAQAAQLSAQAVNTAFGEMSNALFGDLKNSENAFQRFAGTMGSAIMEIIAANLAGSISNAILGTTQTAAAAGPAAALILPGLIASTVGIVTSAFGGIPAFAQGGMVTGPTLAMVGDNASGKEAIIPFEKMGAFMNMMGGSNVNVNITGEFDGDALRLVLDKSSKDLNNLR